MADFQPSIGTHALCCGFLLRDPYVLFRKPSPFFLGVGLDRVPKLSCQVAPGQHEMSPVFRTANVSCDSNVLFMEVGVCNATGHDIRMGV